MISVIGARLDDHEPARNFPKQAPGNGDFRQLERDIPAMAHGRGPDLDHPVARRAP